MKKILSIFLSVIIILSVCSLPAFSLESGNYLYVIENGKAVITGYLGKDTRLSVPNTLGGYKVVAIGEGAFQDNKNIVSVTVGNGICEIRDNAFKSCEKLSEINLPASVIRFGENAITGTAYYNNKFNWTVRPDDLGTSTGDWTLGNGQDTIPWEFIKASKLEYLYLGTVLVKCYVEGTYAVKYDTTVIADGAFSGEEKFKECTLSSKTVTVGARAFKDCTSLSVVTLNDKCKIYEDAFLNTALYNTQSNWKNDFLVIGTRAVASRKNCEELVAGDGITFISNGTIATRNVYIPPSVQYIDIDAFSGKTSVIYGYSGTYAESFANENGFAFVDLESIVMGDMDFDGVLTPNDYAIYYASVTCAHKMTKYEKTVADLNKDGAVDAFDVIYVQLLINDKTAKIKGDINGNGAISKDDYAFLSNVVRCNCTAVGENFNIRADFNGDGVV
ncbi:MAG: leucine-rich repeat protein, partial [Oscillospiraceae bacterium]|nr:leucine-rich repeat protein [Oscillospiraceae bacterium]